MRPIDADELLQDPYFQDESIPERFLFIEAVESAPTINPEDPSTVGKWVWADDGYCRCGNCDHKAPITPQYQDEPVTKATPFCPWCGAKMGAKIEVKHG